MFANIIGQAKDTAFEFSELERLMALEKKVRRLVFYGESEIQYRYYEDYIDYLLAHWDYDICYISSHRQDPILSDKRPRIKSFYIKNLLNTAFSRLDSQVLVLANPDINNGPIKRAPSPVHHVHAFRGIASTHQGYRLGAFDHYDSLLMIQQYQVDEVRKAEELYKLPAKQLPVIGYPLTERIWREHQEFARQNAVARERPVCLVAPTWDAASRTSMLDVCPDEMIDRFGRCPFEVWLRPHPEYVKRFPDRMAKVEKACARTSNVRTKLELGSMQCLHQADILVTDHSTISMDYVLGTERPVVFINTPARVDNPEWTKLGLEPVENSYRSKLGAQLELTELDQLESTLKASFGDRESFGRTIPALRDELIGNWQKAAEVGGNYILGLLTS
ncbi:MAG: CDP-glycerol glycerophosphotransferase family protein [Cyanobacteria bacterium SZAS LIN-3]|nr:CDP-glycerol glycerophosphotransferase family protein [Cyanobacteria bacterium SZAS LIN-3]